MYAVPKVKLIPPSRGVDPATPPSVDDPDEDHELDELPPLDGDPADAAPSEPDLADRAGDDDAASLDDRTGEDEPVDAADFGIEAEESSLDVDADVPGVDFGDFVVADVSERPTTEVDDRPPEEVTFALDDDAAFQDDDEVGIDVGEEGPVGEDEDLSEGDLPDLDDDEQGSQKDPLPVPAAPFNDEPSGLPWAREPWTSVGSPWPVLEATAVACVGHGALVVGRLEGGGARLLLVDLEGACVPVASSGLEPARVRWLTAEGDTVLARTQDAKLFVSSDGGATFVPAEDRAGAAPLARLPADAPGAAPSAPVAFRGSAVAYAGRKGGVVCGGKGRAWSPVVWEGRVTAIVFVDDAGTLAAATYSESDDTTALVRVGPTGEALLVARMGAARAAPEADGRSVAMAFDDARGVLWVAGGFGVAAFAGR